MNQAKILFEEFNGSHHLMWHEGVIDEYSKFNVTKSDEMCWRKEIIEREMSAISKTQNPLRIEEGFGKIISVMSSGNFFISLNDLICEIAKRVSILDSFTNILIAERLADLIRKSISDQQRNLVKNLNNNLIKLLSSSQITVCQEYHQKVWLHGLLSNKTLKDRISKLKYFT